MEQREKMTQTAAGAKSRLLAGAMLWLIVLMAAMVPAGRAEARIGEGNCGANVTWALEDDGTLVIQGTGEMWDCTSGYPMLSGDMDYRVKKIEIRQGVTSVGDYVFSEFWYVKTITLPDSIVSIGQYAFDGCVSLEKILIPDSVASIGQYAFRCCRELGAISIPGSVKEVGECAFFNCEKLKKVVISDGVKSIGSKAFSGCDSLESLSLPESIDSIASGAFQGCHELTSIKIPSGITVIPKYTFMYCRKLKQVTFSEKTTEIGEHAFEKCEALSEITIPKAVTMIRENAFSGCLGLRSIRFEGELPTIYPNSFYQVTAIANYPSGWAVVPETYAYNWNDNYTMHIGNLKWTSYTPSAGKSTKTIKVGAASFRKVYGQKAFPLGASTVSGETLTYSSSNAKVASVDQTGKVTIRGCGKCTITITSPDSPKYRKATKKVTVTVSPKAVTLSSVVSVGKGQLVIKWKADSKVTGYEVLYGTGKNFKNAKKKKISQAKTGSLTLAKLTAGKKYYVKVRAYKTSGGTTLYGKYSKVKSAAISKGTYKVKFDRNKGTRGKVASISSGTGQPVTLPVCNFIRPGYTFNGWNTKANGTGRNYQAAKTVKSLSSKDGAAVTLYATWKKQTGKEKKMAGAVFNQINKVRKAKGLRALKKDTTIEAIAQQRAGEIVTHCYAERPDETDCFTLDKAVNYNKCKYEMVRKGYKNASGLVKDIQKSASEFLYDKKSGRMGIGCCYRNGKYYVVVRIG